MASELCGACGHDRAYHLKRAGECICTLGCKEFRPGPMRSDPVNHPDHYKWLPVEAIEITEHFNFCLGNALKYIMRADRKGKPVEDLRKAMFYLRRELKSRGYSEDE